MILDQYGRPATVFFTSDAFTRLMADIPTPPRAFDPRVMALVDQYGKPLYLHKEASAKVGDTIRVKLPERYGAMACRVIG